MLFKQISFIALLAIANAIKLHHGSSSNDNIFSMTGVEHLEHDLGDGELEKLMQEPRKHLNDEWENAVKKNPAWKDHFNNPPMLTAMHDKEGKKIYYDSSYRSHGLADGDPHADRPLSDEAKKIFSQCSLETGKSGHEKGHGCGEPGNIEQWFENNPGKKAEDYIKQQKTSLALNHKDQKVAGCKSKTDGKFACDDLLKTSGTTDQVKAEAEAKKKAKEEAQRIQQENAARKKAEKEAAKKAAEAAGGSSHDDSSKPKKKKGKGKLGLIEDLIPRAFVA